MKKQMHNKGFTLIELLVVIAIIGILSTLAVISLGNARTKARDSKRLADMRSMQSALEIFYTDQQTYPAFLTPEASACNAATTATGPANIETCCLDNATGGGWKASGCTVGSTLVTVPADPVVANVYTYKQTGATAGMGYSIQFTLENDPDSTGPLASGSNCVTNSGMTGGACP